jgi:hypothetical protein
MNSKRANANRAGAIRGDSTPPTATRSGATRRNSLQLALATACISGVAIFLNSYGSKRSATPPPTQPRRTWSQRSCWSGSSQHCPRADTGLC